MGSRTFCLLTILLSAVNSRAASLFLAVQADGHFVPSISFNSQGQATASDLLTYDQIHVGSGGGITSPPGTALFERAMVGRAGFGNLGASVSAAISGAYVNSPVSTGYVDARYADSLSFSVASGTPEFLAFDLLLGGVGSVPSVFSFWSVSSNTLIGNAQYYFQYQCSGAQPQVQIPGSCGDSPAARPTGNGQIRQTFTVPLSSLQLQNGQTFSISSNLTLQYLLRQSGALPPSASVSADYANTSLLGGFRLLDTNLSPLAATFSSVSGFNYTASLTNEVPEPSTVFLSCFVLFGLLAFRSPHGRN